MSSISMSCATALVRAFRVNNTSLTTALNIYVSVNDVQVIPTTLIPANSVVTLDYLDVLGWNNVILDYFITSGYTPSSASLYINPTTIGAPTSISSTDINYTYVDLTLNYAIDPTANVDLTINP